MGQINTRSTESEKLVAEWLRSEGHKVRHLTDGDDPPDLVVDGDIAVEITTINSFAYDSIWRFLDKTFRELGPTGNGRGYWMSVEYEDEKMLQPRNKREKAKRKKDLKIAIKRKLTEHYDNPDLGVVIQLPYGLTLTIEGEMNDRPDGYKYEVYLAGATEGELVINMLVEEINTNMKKKSDKVRARAANYQEWWLVVTDSFSNVHSLSQDEWKIVSDTIERREPWTRLIAVALDSNGVRRAVSL